MRFIFLVAWREFIENAKTKGFWIGLCVLPMLIFVSTKVSILLQTKGTPVRHYVLVDQSGQFASNITARLEKFNPDWTSEAKASRKAFLPAKIPASIDTNGDLSDIADALKPYLRHEEKVGSADGEVELYAAILIPKDIEKQALHPSTTPNFNDSGEGVEYWSENVADNTLSEQVEQEVNKTIRLHEYKARGMDIAAIHDVERLRAPYANLNPTKESGDEEVSRADILRQWAPSGFVYLLWVSIFAISQMLLNNIIEEKSNRIIEVLLSSVTPGELMMGKLLGIAAIGLTMVGVWISALLVTLTLNYHSGGGADDTHNIAAQLLLTLKTSHLIPMFGVYFLLGYFMYAAFILALGSLCNTIKEAQNYMAVIMMMMMVPLLTMTFIPKDPNGTLARVLSWIPVYTPFTMMNRVNAHPPLVDVIGTLILLAASTAGALWMSGKIFRTGILRTGQPPKIIELLRWLKN